MYGFNSTDISDSSQVVEKFIETNKDFFWLFDNFTLRYSTRTRTNDAFQSRYQLDLEENQFCRINFLLLRGINYTSGF